MEITGVTHQDYKLREMKLTLKLFREFSEKAQQKIIPEIAKIASPPKELKLIREWWLELFEEDYFQNSCADCRGKCCHWFETPPIDIPELFFLTTEYNLVWPEPDWNFWYQEVKDKGKCCLMLSPSGCLLRENRPGICLFFIGCPKLLKGADNRAALSWIIVDSIKRKLKPDEIEKKRKEIAQKICSDPDLYKKLLEDWQKKWSRDETPGYYPLWLGTILEMEKNFDVVVKEIIKDLKI